MKNVQVKFADKAYRQLGQLAKEEETTHAEIVRKGLQLYGVVRAYLEKGSTVCLCDQSGQVQAQLVIPGTTTLEGEAELSPPVSEPALREETDPQALIAESAYFLALRTLGVTLKSARALEVPVSHKRSYETIFANLQEQLDEAQSSAAQHVVSSAAQGNGGSMRRRPTLGAQDGS